MEDRSTIFFNMETEKPDQDIVSILNTVFDALEEKGYNAIDQLVGYILSGDPSYITSHNNARSLIKHLERDEIVEEILRAFLNKKK